MDRKELEQIFQKVLIETPEWPIALELVRRCAKGKTYLVGGFIYRHLANRLYGASLKSTDFDFVADGVETSATPDGWTTEQTKFGGPRFRNGRIQVDLWPVWDRYGIQHDEKDFTIESYLACVPLSIQAIAYDIEARKLLGDIGFTSVLTRTVAPHCRACFDRTRKHLNISAEAYLTKKASSLGFSIADKLAACV